jgi:hypothetical protein
MGTIPPYGPYIHYHSSDPTRLLGGFFGFRYWTLTTCDDVMSAVYIHGIFTGEKKDVAHPAARFFLLPSGYLT